MYKKMYAILLSFSINNPGNSKQKKINSQLIFKLWKISNYENQKKMSISLDYLCVLFLE